MEVWLQTDAPEAIGKGHVAFYFPKLQFSLPFLRPPSLLSGGTYGRLPREGPHASALAHMPHVKALPVLAW